MSSFFPFYMGAKSCTLHKLACNLLGQTILLLCLYLLTKLNKERMKEHEKINEIYGFNNGVVHDVFVRCICG